MNRQTGKQVNRQTDQPANRQTGKLVNRLTGQTSLELTVALVIFAMLFVAAVKIFVWLNAGLVNRQVAYDNTRVKAGSSKPERVIGITNLKHKTPGKLRIVSIDGTKEVKVNEPLNADLNLTSEF
ncbi:MAG: hypothetical protein HZB36_03465 [Candidatus Omnitrophica bacterium]|nr:hypothetical protein [Candidatus Omnitrophota bacterium]